MFICFAKNAKKYKTDVKAFLGRQNRQREKTKMEKKHKVGYTSESPRSRKDVDS